MSVMPLGPVLAAIEGLELSPADRERLLHPHVGGVTLFARNYAEPKQLTALCEAIHRLREPQLLICVDHEGGRVQRFRDGFTRLPPMGRIGALWATDRQPARAAAWAAGAILAAELRGCGVDLSFAPVLDLDYGASTIIGDRALHRDPQIVADLAAALIEGQHAFGMRAVGKHFPGHGYIAADSHLELPVDERSLQQIAAQDLVPFRTLAPRLAGVMTAHVLYPQVDSQPAGFSRRWIGEILRADLGFAGAVVSDDLGMQGAACAGPLQARAEAAFASGCDLVLACTTHYADVVLSELCYVMPEASRARLHALLPQAPNAAAAVNARSLAQARATLAPLTG
jgi:beta-N-acetylhexosaminidase